MTFSLHQGGVVMSSQIKHPNSHQDTPLSTHTQSSRYTNVYAILMKNLNMYLQKSLLNRQSIGHGSKTLTKLIIIIIYVNILFVLKLMKILRLNYLIISYLVLAGRRYINVCRMDVRLNGKQLEQVVSW